MKASVEFQKATSSQKRITKVEDDRACNQAECQSLRPNLDLQQHHPEPPKMPRAPKKFKPTTKSKVHAHQTWNNKRLLNWPLPTLNHKILVDFDMEASPGPDPLEMEEDADDLHYEPLGPGQFFSPDDINLPPTSTIDTKSDFADCMDTDDEDEISSSDFKPSKDEGEAEDKDANNGAGSDSELACATAVHEFEAKWTKKQAQEKNAEKRKEAAERQKCRKPTIAPKLKPDIGGLCADAQKMLLKQKAVASSNLLLILSEGGSGTSRGTAGDFDQDESVASLTAACEMKKKGPKAKSKSQSVEDIPKWDTQCMPHIYNFIGAQEAQFGMNSNLELKVFQAILWAEIFPALKEDANEPAITGVHAESKGAMQGPGVLETFSLHLKFTQNVSHPDPPTGALALCADAYLRTLHAWQPGFISMAETWRLAKEEKVQSSKGNILKNNKDTGFSNKWAPPVLKYYLVLKTTPKTKWPTILDHARPFMNSKCCSTVTIKREMEDSEGMENGADDEFIMSD
ncbi:hypothetical protein BT96DRAFT_944476 [Gymnopus androsaceus JB14]|uniref:Uncharacterized protein n=1 Tax=Gymnopus androsaceus JB14 TaxID=1447944 RepID=A0A6A4H4M1_9AGAR|nr:hypothetical protein BT96DRAFT_944476 [Gymnopus androsaceus JB14]